MNFPLKKLPLPLALLAVLGCHHDLRTRNLKFTMAHDQAAQTATVTCTDSSTGKCHFAFTGPVTPATADVKTGDSFVFQNVSPDTKFCAEAHKPDPNSCTKSPLPEHTATTEKRFNSDALSN